MGIEEAIQDWQDFRRASILSDTKPTLNVIDYDGDKFRIVLLGDEHIDNRTYDELAHRQQVNWCLDNEVPIIHMGDALECATRDSIGAGVYEQSAIIEHQIEHFYDIYRPLADADLILGLHPGNHELRLKHSSGIILTKILAKELKVPYFGWGKLHYLRVGDQRYTMYTTHGATGALLPHTKIKAVLDLQRMVEADIYAMGHTHQLSHHTREFYKENRRNLTVERGQKDYILTGSYLRHWGSYAHVKNYEPVRLGSPTLKLGGTKHSVRVVL